ncbi:hypothetical protein H0H92_011533 [Tricholoma furcatifolium]|nr:hypothetical protein H0H92_011533 [Tricholoma furcatifolium]
MRAASRSSVMDRSHYFLLQWLDLFSVIYVSALLSPRRQVLHEWASHVLFLAVLVLGMCFFAGGLKYSEQGFGASASQLNSSLLTISVIAILLPAAYNMSATDPNEGQDILKLSRGLYSHASLFDDSEAVKSKKYEPDAHPTMHKLKNKVHDKVHKITGKSDEKLADVESAEHKEEEEEEVPQMNVLMTLALLAIVTVLVAVTAEWLVDSIDGMTSGGGISKEFVGMILLPIVGNAAEHVTAVTVAVKDKLNLSIGVAVGSSIVSFRIVQIHIRLF